jgi:hypothetical protein
MELIVDPARKLRNNHTGIYVRAKQHDGTWGNFDICHLEKASLLAWLKSKGGDNSWAENVVGILLGYGPLHS